MDSLSALLSKEDLSSVVFDAANNRAEAPPVETSALVRCDRMGSFWILHRPWENALVKSNFLSLAPISVGGKSCCSQAGSFTGFLRSADENRYGMARHHCVPSLEMGSDVASPSGPAPSCLLPGMAVHSMASPKPCKRRLRNSGGV